jgi:mRNA-degrading endonuclease toxin of MazEF toxin-antitoxin module
MNAKVFWKIAMIVALVSTTAAFANTTTATTPATTSSKKKSTSKVSAPPMQTGAKLSTNVQFDELSVHGRYQAGDTGYATVEDEKALDDLLDYRKEYKDRLRSSQTQK